MTNYPRCITCKHYNETYSSCENSPKLNDMGSYFKDSLRKSDELRYAYDEGGHIYVGEQFGCVHHKEQEGKQS